jgi:hypothetical protein
VILSSCDKVSSIYFLHFSYALSLQHDSQIVNIFLMLCSAHSENKTKILLNSAILSAQVCFSFEIQERQT